MFKGTTGPQSGRTPRTQAEKIGTDSAGFKEDPAYDYKGGHPTGPGMPSGEYSEKPMKGGGGTAPLDPAVPFTLKP